MSAFNWIPCVKNPTCAMCCTVYSVGAAIFLVVLSILMESQPEYLKLPICDEKLKDDPKCVNTMEACFQDCKGDRAGGMMFGAGLYVVCAILCGMCWAQHARRARNSSGRPDAYELNPLNESLLTGGYSDQ